MLLLFFEGLLLVAPGDSALDSDLNAILAFLATLYQLGVGSLEAALLRGTLFMAIVFQLL